LRLPHGNSVDERQCGDARQNAESGFHGLISFEDVS
jgi:hypothetical protein